MILSVGGGFAMKMFTMDNSKMIADAAAFWRGEHLDFF